MKYKSLIRQALTLLLIITFLCSFPATALAASHPDFATGGYSDGGTDYEASARKTADGEFVTPIYTSQAYHTQGYVTTIGVTETYSKTWNGGGSITGGFSGVFLSLAATIGVDESTSHSVSVTVSYTIPEGKESGYYRIELRCPKFTVREELLELTERGSTMVYNELLPDMPGLNAGYHILVRYQ